MYTPLPPQDVFERLGYDFPIVTPTELDALSQHLSATAAFPGGRAPSRRLVGSVCEGARRNAVGSSAERCVCVRMRAHV